MAYNNSFQQRLESLHYKTSLAITGAINGPSTEKLYHELGLESLQNRRWFRKLSVFYKTVNGQSQNIYLTLFLQTTFHTKQEIVVIGWFPSL